MTPPEASIRDLDDADLAWVAEQERAIFGGAAWSSALLTQDFAYGGKRYRGVAMDGELVAYAVYGFDGDAFSLMNLAVVPEARGKGLGRLLVDDFLAEAARLAAHEAWLEVAVNNESALALYRSYGFEDVRVRPRYYQPDDVDALVMRVRLPRSD